MKSFVARFSSIPLLFLVAQVPAQVYNYTWMKGVPNNIYTATIYSKPNADGTQQNNYGLCFPGAEVHNLFR